MIVVKNFLFSHQKCYRNVHSMIFNTTLLADSWKNNVFQHQFRLSNKLATKRRYFLARQRIDFVYCHGRDATALI